MNQARQPFGSDSGEEKEKPGLDETGLKKGHWAMTREKWKYPWVRGFQENCICMRTRYQCDVASCLTLRSGGFA